MEIEQKNNDLVNVSSNAVPPQNKNIGGLLGVVLLLVILIGAVSGVNWWLKSQKNISVNQKSKTALVTQPSSQQASQPVEKDKVSAVKFDQMRQELFTWLDKQKNNGVYLFVKNCKSGYSNCDSNVGTTSGLDVMWGKYRFYSKSKDAEVLKSLNTDLTNYVNMEIVDTIQVDLWSCKLMEEIWYDTTLPEDTRSMARQVCERSQYHPKYEMEAEAAIRSEEASVDFSRVVELINTSGDLDSQDSLVRQYAGYASDMAVAFESLGEQMGIAKAKYYLGKSLTEARRIQSEGRRISEATKCTIGIGALDVYRIDKDNKYLDFARAIYQNLAWHRVPKVMDRAVCAKFFEELGVNVEDGAQKISEIEAALDQLNWNEQVGAFEDKEEKSFFIRANGLLLGLINSQ